MKTKNKQDSQIDYNGFGYNGASKRFTELMQLK